VDAGASSSTDIRRHAMSDEQKPEQKVTFEPSELELRDQAKRIEQLISSGLLARRERGIQRIMDLLRTEVAHKRCEAAKHTNG
jgi:negative regulator of replication initiation